MRLDGRRVAAALEEELAAEVAALGPPPPVLAVVLASDDALAHRQVGLKREAADRVGVVLRSVALAGSAGQREVEATVAGLASDDGVDALFVQLPLPGHVDEQAVLAQVPTGKDVDALAPGSAEPPATVAGAARLVEGVRGRVALEVHDEAVAAALRRAGVAVAAPGEPADAVVPARGGLGPVTVAVLLERTVRRRASSEERR